MRCRCVVALFVLMAGNNAMAQSTSAPGSSGTPPQLYDPAAQHGPQNNSYLIAPGVSVTPLYQGAQPAISTYSPDSTQAAYTPHIYDSASYSQPSYSQPLQADPGTSAYLSTPQATTMASGDGYVPQTAYDNTPYRFYMQQNGQQMSAQDFEEWMRSRGIRIARGQQ